jgi:hypothetical protein
MNVVHTYYEPLPNVDESIQRAELAVWRESWERWGWECKVLGRGDVVITIEEMERLQRLPSVNPQGYDLACYLRWFAMRAIGGGLMVDYDVVNIGFRAPAIVAGPDIICLCNYYVPCAMALTSNGAAQWCQMMLGYEPTADDTYEGRPHVSDMTILQRASDRHVDELLICQEPQVMTDKTLMLHASRHAMKAIRADGLARHQVMAILARLHSERG